MDMEDVSKKVLERIKEKKVIMIPRWHFVFYKSLAFALLFMLFVLGVSIFSLICHLVFHFEILGIIKNGPSLRMILRSMPYFWLLLLGIAVLLILIEFMRTSFGYKIKKRFILLSLVFLTFIFGLGLYFAGTGDFIENVMENYFPSYGNIVKTPKNFWLQPENGLLSGSIIVIDDEMKVFELKDWKDTEWEVNYAGALILQGASLKERKKIKIIGKDKGMHRFEAKEIRKWPIFDDNK